MISIKNTLVSEDLLEQEFVCDLSACKGACCVAGDGGAPLNEEELDILESIYEDVKPYMAKKGVKGVEAQGKWVVGEDGGKETPLVRGKECVYVFFAWFGHLKTQGELICSLCGFNILVNRLAGVHPPC